VIRSHKLQGTPSLPSEHPEDTIGDAGLSAGALQHGNRNRRLVNVQPTIFSQLIEAGSFS